MGLPLPWIKHLSNQDSERRDNFEAAVRNSTIALGRLRELLQESLEGLNNKEFTDKQFEDPNWSHKQAYWNGQRSAFKQILNLLTFDQK